MIIGPPPKFHEPRASSRCAPDQLVAQNLELPTVSRHMAEAARELVGACSAALRMIAPSRGPAPFVHAGMPAEVVAAIGHLPQGEGLLGARIEDPAPIRLRTLVEDTRSDRVPVRAPADARLPMLCRAANASGGEVTRGSSRTPVEAG